jgi:hypothetical protein
MSPLTFATPSTAAPTINVLLYGPPGTGKSMGAATAPGPIFYLNAEGPGAVRLVHQTHGEKIREVVVEGAKTLDESFLYLRAGKGGEKTVVIDTVGEVYRVLLEELSGGRAMPSLQNYGDVNTKIERFVRALRDLDINVVLIAHEQVDDEEGQATRRPMTGGKKLPETVMAQVDIVAYTGVIAATDDQPRRFVGQLVEAKGRRAKSRWMDALGNSRDLDISEWVDTATAAMAGAATSTEPEPEGKKQLDKSAAKSKGKSKAEETVAA